LNKGWIKHVPFINVIKAIDSINPIKSHVAKKAINIMNNFGKPLDIYNQIGEKLINNF